jgi:glycosyltransferase involved in cell wall biosynthesis
MRVLHVIPAVGPTYGGPSRAIVGMTESLADRGVEVHVATTDRDGAARLDVPLDRPVSHNGVVYHYFPTLPSGEWKLSLSLARWLYSNVRAYDLVHVHALFSFSTIPGCRAASASGVPYVVRPLGTLTSASLRFRSWKKKPYYALVERRHLSAAAAIHVTSPQEESAIRSLGFGSRVRLVPLGVDASRSQRIVRNAAGRVRFLYLGRLHPIKQLPLLIESFGDAARALGGGIELVIVGGGDTAYRRQLEQMVERASLVSHVRFAGELEHTAAQQLLVDADVFVLPSRTENFGLAAAEGLAAGLPVIVTEDVGLASDVSRAHAGRVVPSDRRALANAIAELAQNAALRSVMSANARRLADERFSWSHSADALLDLYSELTSVGPDTSALVRVS